MAKGKNSQRNAVSVSAAAAKTALVGTFAFRFDGYTMAQDRPWYLTGIGRFNISAEGKLTGAQQAAIMPIHGLGAELQSATYALNGIISVKNDGTGNATILYTKTAGRGKNTEGNFYVLQAEADRFWLVSSENEKTGPATEIVNLEAIRI